MKLNQEQIDGIIARKNRHRDAEKLYCFIGVHGGQQLRTAFDGLLQQLVIAGAFENIGSHYKLIDKDILYNFKKRSDI